MSRSKVVRSSRQNCEQVVVAARPGQHLHQLDRRPQEAVEPLRRPRRPGSRARRCGFWVAMPTGQLSVWQARMPEAADRLDRASWRSPPRRRRARAPWRSRRASRSPPVTTSVTSRRPRWSRWRRARASAGIVGHRDVVAEEQRRRAGAAAATVEDDVVDADLERGVDVGLDVLGRQLGADRDAARALAHLVGEAAEVVDRRASRGSVGGDTAGVPSGRPRTSAMRPTTLGPGRWPPVPVLAPWPPLKWNACTFARHVPRPAEAGRRQLVEVAASSRPAPRAACRPRPSRCRCPRARAPRGQRGLRLLRQRAEAHVGDEDRDVEPQRLVGVRADAHLGADRLRRRAAAGAASCAVTNWMCVPASAAARAARPWPTTGPWWPTLVEPVGGQLVDAHRRTAPRATCADRCSSPGTRRGRTAAGGAS